MKQFPTLIGAALALMPLTSTQADEGSLNYGPLGSEETALRFSGTERVYRPILRTRLGPAKLELPLSAANRYEAFEGTEVDPDGSTFNPDAAFNTQIRVGALFDSNRFSSLIFFKAEYEHDLITGVASGGDDTLDAVDDEYYGAEETESQLRKAYGRLTLGPLLTVSGGYQMSHWGLGLLANDGAHGWTPGSAYFGDPRSGDRVLRFSGSTGPWTNGKLVLFGGYDVVQGDDIMINDDEASQVVAGATLGYKEPNQIGIYMAIRDQEAPDGQTIDVNAVDVYAKYTLPLRRGELVAEFEAAYIFGETTLAPTVDFQKYDIEQLGMAGRLNYNRSGWGLVTDIVFASGDQNFDDNQQNTFQVDPNYELGLVLYRHLMTASTARGATRAADLDLVGVPNEDLDRLPTRGSVSNTLAFFPRAWMRPADGFEVYGGPLIAFSNVSSSDPRNTRLAGGDPRNAFNGEPGGYLGTELDLGLRWRALVEGAEIMAGLEGGLLLPGSALEDATGRTPNSLAGGRAILRVRL